MRIIKTSQTTPTTAQVVNTYSDSQTNTYSCDYINGTVLYNNASGTSGNITLSDNISNYSKIEVYYRAFDRGSGEIRMCDPKYSNYIVLEAIGFSSELTRHYDCCTRYLLSGTSMTIDQARLTTIYSSSISNENNNGINIYKIIGYK